MSLWRTFLGRAEGDIPPRCLRGRWDVPTSRRLDLGKRMRTRRGSMEVVEFWGCPTDTSPTDDDWRTSTRVSKSIYHKTIRFHTSILTPFCPVSLSCRPRGVRGGDTTRLRAQFPLPVFLWVGVPTGSHVMSGGPGRTYAGACPSTSRRTPDSAGPHPHSPASLPTRLGGPGTRGSGTEVTPGRSGSGVEEGARGAPRPTWNDILYRSLSSD